MKARRPILIELQTYQHKTKKAVKSVTKYFSKFKSDLKFFPLFMKTSKIVQPFYIMPDNFK